MVAVEIEKGRWVQNSQVSLIGVGDWIWLGGWGEWSGTMVKREGD